MRRLPTALVLAAGIGFAAIPENVPNLRASSDFAPAPARPETRRSYATRFAIDEAPVSEHGGWIGGKTAGRDWADIATSGGFAYGLEPGGAGGYDDSTALLAGAWAPNQEAEATVHTVNQTDQAWEEVEIRLRSELSPHVATGYEINFRCLRTEKAYSEIVRWNGPLGSFTYLSQKRGLPYGVKDGDVVRATIVGNVITAYINGVQVNQATDGTFATGRPGMGMFLAGKTGVNRDYGFTSFSASDSP